MWRGDPPIRGRSRRRCYTEGSRLGVSHRSPSCNPASQCFADYPPEGAARHAGPRQKRAPAGLTAGGGVRRSKGRDRQSCCTPDSRRAQGGGDVFSARCRARPRLPECGRRGSRKTLELLTCFLTDAVRAARKPSIPSHCDEPRRHKNSRNDTVRLPETSGPGEISASLLEDSTLSV